MRSFWAVVGYGLACAICLTFFSMIQDLIKYAFSLGAFFLGLRFFRFYETWGVRIAFILTSIALYFVVTVIYTVLAIANGWPIPTMPQP